MSGSRAPRIASIDVLKLVCVLGIFCWHAGLLGERVDWGARLCDVFFACSGLLEGFLHHGRFAYTLRESVGLLWRRLRSAWPLHVAILVVAGIVARIGGSQWTLWENKQAAIVNALLVQAWFENLAFSFNGSAWFLSAIAFCWLMTPSLDLALCSLERRLGTRRATLLALAGLLCCVVFLEQAIVRRVLCVGVYAFPPLRLAAYGVAYVVGCRLGDTGQGDVSGRPHVPGGFVARSCVETLLLLAYVGLCVAFVDTSRVVFVAGAAVLVAGLVLCRGSLLCGLGERTALRYLSSLQLPFFLSQQVCIDVCSLPALAPYLSSTESRAAAALVLCLAFCALWSAAWRRVAPARTRALPGAAR